MTTSHRGLQCVCAVVSWITPHILLAGDLWAVLRAASAGDSATQLNAVYGLGMPSTFLPDRLGVTGFLQ